MSKSDPGGQGVTYVWGPWAPTLTSFPGRIPPLWALLTSWTCGSSPSGPWVSNGNGIWQEVLIPGWRGALRGWQVIVWA